MKANEEKARTLADERKTFQSERAQVAQAYQSQLQQVQGLGEMLQNKLTQEFQSIDWDRLRVPTLPSGRPSSKSLHSAIRSCNRPVRCWASR